MSVSGIGSINSYIYNRNTGRIMAKDGQKDEFVDYFNGDLTEEDSSTLNGFDQERKCGIKKMLEMIGWGMLEWGTEGQNRPENLQEDEVEITTEKIDATTTVTYLNGEKILTVIGSVRYTREELDTLGTSQPYRTTCPTGYDSSRNRLSIGVGSRFEFGNGYRFTVGNDTVRVDSYGRGTEEDILKADTFACGVSALIHFGDQQAFSGWVNTPMMLEFLRESGVDTDREFMINDTVCEVRNGMIKEVGNQVGILSSIYQKAMKRYEEMLYLPLSKK